MDNILSRFINETGTAHSCSKLKIRSNFSNCKNICSDKTIKNKLREWILHLDNKINPMFVSETIDIVIRSQHLYDIVKSCIIVS